MNKIDGLGELVTLVGAAKALHTTRWRVYHFVRRNRVPTTRLGKSILVRLADLALLRP